MNDFAYVLGVILLVFLVIILGPLLVIWALNTLFILGIEMNLATWFAILVLVFAANGSLNISAKEKP